MVQHGMRTEAVSRSREAADQRLTVRRGVDSEGDRKRGWGGGRV
jgi:hypothetical protein